MARWLLLLTLTAALATAAAPRGRNLVTNPGFEDGLTGWQTVGRAAGVALDEQVKHSGRRSLRVTGDTPDSTQGVKQVFDLDAPLQHPFRLSGWSKAENARLGQDYDLYLDLHYADGTPLWGKVAGFATGTHDWQRSELVFDVAKPVTSIEFHVLFRKAQGTVWFDDLELTPVPLELHGLRLLRGLFGGDSLAVSAAATLPGTWRARVLDAGGAVLREGQGRLPVAWAASGLGATARTLELSATDDLQGETLTQRQPLTLGARRDARGYAVWTESSMTRVRAQRLPERVDPRPSARIDLAGNEDESFQVVLLAPGPEALKQVKVTASDLTDGRGHRIPANQVTVEQVGFVKLDKVAAHPAEPDESPGWWPDPLLPVSTFDVEPGQPQPVWLTVHAPAGTPKGEYRGTVTVAPQGRPAATVQVAATVYGFDLPTRGHLKTAFALMDGYLEQLYGKPLSPKLRQAYGDYLLRRRLNPDDISRTEAPAIEDLEHYRDRGLNAFNVMNLVEERGKRTWVCFSDAKVYTPAFKQRLIERLEPAVAAIRKAGLTDRAYIYSFDERGDDFIPIYREYFGLIHQRYPGIATMTTAKIDLDPAVMKDLQVDWNCPLTPRYDYAAAERCRAAGQQVWAYVCLGPRYPYANWLVDHPLAEARVFFWQAFAQKMDGVLYWGLNIWGRPHNDRVIDPAKGPRLDWSITTGGQFDWLHGDGELIYPGPDGPIGSIRVDNLRDGLDDYEYLWLLAQKVGWPAAQAACEPVTRSLTEFTRDPAVVRATRAGIAERLGKG